MQPGSRCRHSAVRKRLGPEPGTFPKFDDPAERMSGTARKDRATSGINMVFIYMNTDLVSVLFVFLSKLLPKERV